MLSGARPRCSVIADFLDFCEDDFLIGHNVIFDYSFMKCSASAENLPFEKSGIDTLKIAQKVHRICPPKAWAACATIIISKTDPPTGLITMPLATAKLYQTLAHHFEEQDPKLFKPVQLTYKIKKPQPATPKQLALLSNLIRKTKAEVTWDTKTLTRSEASRIIDRLLNNRA